jgi:hypothetical protein
MHDYIFRQLDAAHSQDVWNRSGCKQSVSQEFFIRLVVGAVPGGREKTFGVKQNPSNAIALVTINRGGYVAAAKRNLDGSHQIAGSFRSLVQSSMERTKRHDKRIAFGQVWGKMLGNGENPPASGEVIFINQVHNRAAGRGDSATGIVQLMDLGVAEQLPLRPSVARLVVQGLLESRIDIHGVSLCGASRQADGRPGHRAAGTAA